MRYTGYIKFLPYIFFISAPRTWQTIFAVSGCLIFRGFFWLFLGISKYGENYAQTVKFRLKMGKTTEKIFCHDHERLLYMSRQKNSVWSTGCIGITRKYFNKLKYTLTTAIWIWLIDQSFSDILYLHQYVLNWMWVPSIICYKF